MFAFNANAFTLDFNDSRSLGWVDPSDATGNAHEAVYVNTLCSFAQGSGLHSGIDGHDYLRRDALAALVSLPSSVPRMTAAITP